MDELRSSPDDATIAEGLRRAYRPYVVTVAALFATVVPVLTLARAWSDGAWLGRTVTALLIVAAGAWATRRAMRDLVRSGVKARSGREAVARLPLASPRVHVTEHAVVVRGKGAPAIVLARADVPADVLDRLRPP